ncbi:NMT1/THI5 like protein [compost metagenome]
MPIGNETAPVVNNKADFALTVEPVISQVISEERLEAVYSFSQNADWYPFAFSSLCTTEEYIEKNPEAAQGIVNAIEKATQFIQKYPTEAIEIAKQEFPDTDPGVVEAAINRVIGAKGYPEHALASEKSWENNMNIAFNSGNIKEYPADYSSYETNVNTELATNAEKNVKLD